MGLILLSVLLFGMEFFVCANNKSYSSNVARERLVTDLFNNYDASTRPAPKGTRIDLNVNITLQHFTFQESDGAFHFIGYLDVTWNNPKLKWNPVDYSNVKRIPVNQKTVWVPDLEIYNNAPDKMLRMHRNGIVVLSSDGTLLWSDTIEITTFCTTNLQDWPHDKHSCKLTLGSWTYHALDLDIAKKNLNTSTNYDDIELHNTEYKIINFTATHVSTVYSCCTEHYSSIIYSIDFERRAGCAIVFRVISICVVLFPVLSLSLEVHRREKIILNAIGFMVVILQLQYFVKEMGHFSRGTPSVVKFHLYSLIFITFTNLVNVFVLMAIHSKIKGKLPYCLKRFLNSTLIRSISRDSNGACNESNHDSSSNITDGKVHDCSSLIAESSYSSDWIHLAVFIERVVLYSVVPLFLITIGSYMV